MNYLLLLGTQNFYRRKWSTTNYIWTRNTFRNACTMLTAKWNLFGFHWSAPKSSCSVTMDYIMLTDSNKVIRDKLNTCLYMSILLADTYSRNCSAITVRYAYLVCLLLSNPMHLLTLSTKSYVIYWSEDNIIWPYVIREFLFCFHNYELAFDFCCLSVATLFKKLSSVKILFSTWET